MQRFSLFIVAAVLVLLNGGCTGTASGGGGGTTKVFSIDGRAYTAEELIKSPFVRAGLTQQIMYAAMKSELAKRNLQIDTAEVDRRVAEMKNQVEAGGENWNDYLAKNSMQEEEIRQRMAGELEWKALIDSMSEITEDDIKEKWEQRQELFVQQYLQEHHLPEAERPNIAIEDVRYLIEEYITSEQNFQNNELLLKEITDNTDFEILCFRNTEDADLYEFLIFDSRKSTEDEDGGRRPQGGSTTALDEAPAEETESADDGGAEAEGDASGETAPEGEDSEGGASGMGEDEGESGAGG
jgi:hypothetical protein